MEERRKKRKGGDGGAVREMGMDGWREERERGLGNRQRDDRQERPVTEDERVKENVWHKLSSRR